MALLWADSFDSYAAADILQCWTSLSAGTGSSTITITSSNGYNSTGSLRLYAVPGAGQNSGYIRLVPSMPAPTGSTFILQARFYFTGGTFTGLDTGTDPDTTGDSACLFGVRNAGTMLFWFRIQKTGHITLYRGTTVVGTSTTAFSEGVWHYAKFKVVLHDTLGTCTVKIDDTTVLSLTGVDTTAGGTTWDTVQFGQWCTDAGVGACICDIDHLLIMDGSGARNNDFVGDYVIEWIVPTAEGTTLGWTPDTGTVHYSRVDDDPSDGDTTYVKTTTVGAVDTYNFPDVPVAGAPILGVVHKIYAKKEDGGDSETAAVTRISSTNYVGTSRVTPGSYAMLQEIWDVKPSDSQVWNYTDVNAAEMGVKKTV